MLPFVLLAGGAVVAYMLLKKKESASSTPTVQMASDGTISFVT